METEPSDRCWAINKILQVSKKPVKNGQKSIFYKAQFNDGDKAWFSMDTLRVEDPFTVINHAYTNGYYEESGFEWIKDYLETEDEMEEVLKIFNAKGNDVAKYKFGIEVPRN